MHVRMRTLDLFSGLGGFAHGLESTGGFTTSLMCEIDPYRRSVLNNVWPGVPIAEDVKLLRGKELRGSIDVITGGFPCTDLSVANREKLGLQGERSGLFYEIVRLAREIHPKYIILENVRNILSGPPGRKGGWFLELLTQLARIRYDAEWEVVPAAAVGAPHKRDRIWIVAYPDSEHEYRRGKEWTSRGSKPTDSRGRVSGPGASVGDSDRPRLERLWKHIECARQRTVWSSGVPLLGKDETCRIIEPSIPLVADGVPHRVARLRAIGDTLVPEIAWAIGETLVEFEKAVS